ncbi:MAG: flagellar biosynthesis protein FlhA [Planctomycetota bacterium]|jgi:flagellar biosynthesis protein FlhA|nr:flagellar biosynthesis protein FlhA [Planctomycetota bacterium]MDP6501972.1 flagellar biosynthesis protein FlhA [Planctomycetota bacterium]
MENAPGRSLPRTIIEGILSKNEYILAAGVVGILTVLIVPVPSVVIDLLLTTSVAIALLVLFATLQINHPLEMSSFPALLLFTTMFRLGLNISTTRSILLHGEAGEVIEAFGQFVVGGNMVVGMIIFSILVIIQFIVITKGASRISEVAARFTLDAMPGKQMAVDADLSAGLIDEDDARSRRNLITKEAEFQGSMDGAAKFVRGDTIAGLIITVINIVGGIIIGMTSHGLSAADALEKYAILTVGDGLVSQIPSMIIAIASGILVTNTSSDAALGADLIGQVAFKPKSLLIGSTVLLGLGLVPGLPTFAFLTMSAVFGVGWFILQSQEKEDRVIAEQQAMEHQQSMEQQQAQEQAQVQDTPEQALSVDRMGIEIGYKLIPVVDPNMDGNLLSRITALRKQVAGRFGYIIPPIRIKDNLQLPPSTYSILLRGQEIAKGELMLDHFLAMESGGVTEQLEGVRTTEPAFGLPAIWIPASEKERADAAGYATIDPVSVLVTHLMEILQSHAHEILTREDAQHLIGTAQAASPTVVEELIPDLLPISSVQQVLTQLLKERVPIVDLSLILETLANHARQTQDPELLAEHCRQALGRSVCATYQNQEGRLGVLALDPNIEQSFSRAVQQTDTGPQIILSPQFTQQFIEATINSSQQAMTKGFEPVLLVSSSMRRLIRRLLENSLPRLAIVAYNEIPAGISTEIIDTVRVQMGQPAAQQPVGVGQPA